MNPNSTIKLGSLLVLKRVFHFLVNRSTLSNIWPLIFYSTGGQKQRINIARAIYCDADIQIFDVGFYDYY